MTLHSSKLSDGHVFETMNGLRGFAALLVVGFHWSLREPLGLGNGFLAVDLFFVLSGFVIAHSYEKRLQNGLRARDFFLLRLVRLYPLYLLGTLISILVALLSFLLKGRVIETYANAFNSVPWALLMLPLPPQMAGRGPESLYPLNSPAWSLFFELLINSFYVLTFRWWTHSILFKYLLIMNLVIISVSIIVGTPLSGGDNWNTAAIGLLRVLYSFPAGVLVYRIYERRITDISIPTPIIMAIFITLIMLPSIWGVPFSILIGFPFLVFLAANNEPKRILSPVFASLGIASYAIYAIHQPLHIFTVNALNNLGLPHGIAADLTFLFLIVPICIAIDKIYDAPVRKSLARTLLRASNNSFKMT